MRSTYPDCIEQSRIKFGPYGSALGYDCGAFIIFAPSGRQLKIIVGRGDSWEHVSVSCQTSCPTWEEMDWVKDQFWLPTETVMQLHVPKRDHINCHPHCLHLWRPLKGRIPLPPSEMVGPTAA